MEEIKHSIKQCEAALLEKQIDLMRIRERIAIDRALISPNYDAYLLSVLYARAGRFFNDGQARSAIEVQLSVGGDARLLWARIANDLGRTQSGLSGASDFISEWIEGRLREGERSRGSEVLHIGLTLSPQVPYSITGEMAENLLSSVRSFVGALDQRCQSCELTYSVYCVLPHLVLQPELHHRILLSEPSPERPRHDWLLPQAYAAGG